jgi:hypothetical protein
MHRWWWEFGQIGTCPTMRTCWSIILAFKKIIELWFSSSKNWITWILQGFWIAAFQCHWLINIRSIPISWSLITDCAFDILYYFILKLKLWAQILNLQICHLYVYRIHMRIVIFYSSLGLRTFGQMFRIM